MPTFGLVTEGITDQIVLEGVLIGLFGKDVEIAPLQPLRDATNQHIATNTGNWNKVMTYCQSEKLKEALRQEDYVVIIQLDTDVFLTADVPKEYQINAQSTVTETIELMRLKLIQLISSEFYEANQHKIIFAIAVHATECWLLPAYLETDAKRAGKVVKCLDELNKALKNQEDFYINEKKPEYYEVMAKRYWKNKTLMKVYAYSPSLKIFIDDLQARF